MARIPVQVIAHRGASYDFPENTPAAFAAALEQGCDGIELDLQLTLDYVPVVYHDKNLARLDLPDQQVADLELSELQARAAASSFYGPREERSIATMDDVLDRIGHRTLLYIEIKTRESGEPGRLRHVELLRRAIDAVRVRGLEESVSILSYDRGLLEICGQVAPALPRVLNVKPGAGGATIPPAMLFPGALDGLAALSADIRTLTPEFAARVRAAGCPLLAFVCNEVREVRAALQAGAVGIMCDRPGWLRSVMAPSPIPGLSPILEPRGESL